MDEEAVVMEKPQKKITVVPEKLVFQQASGEATPETETQEEKVIANPMAEETTENQTVEEEAETEPAAAKVKVDETEVKAEEEGNGINMIGFLVQLVIVVITVHGYLEYRTFSGETGNWLWALSSLLLPVINLGGVFCGLIYYWEIHWGLALIITATCFFALLPKAPGYVCAVICVALFITCASYTFPERKSEAQMEREFTNDLNRASNFVTSLPLSGDPNIGVKEVKEHMRKIRVRALRLGYQQFPEQLDQALRGKK